jgi:hypothetical protein
MGPIRKRRGLPAAESELRLRYRVGMKPRILFHILLQFHEHCHRRDQLLHGYARSRSTATVLLRGWSAVPVTRPSNHDADSRPHRHRRQAAALEPKPTNCNDWVFVITRASRAPTRATRTAPALETGHYLVVKRFLTGLLMAMALFLHMGVAGAVRCDCFYNCVHAFDFF